MAAHHSHDLPPGEMKALNEVIGVVCKNHGPFESDEDIVQYFNALLMPRNKPLRLEFHMKHAYKIYKGMITITTKTPPTVPPHASHGAQPTTIGPSQSNDPKIILDQATRQFINIKPPGSTEWQGMCALNCQESANFISVEAMRKRRLPVENGGQYECAWEVDGVTRIGIFKAVSQLGADVAFGLDDRPGPATTISIDTASHSPSKSLAGSFKTGQGSKPSIQLSIDDHPARPESQDSCTNTRHQKQRHPGAPIPMRQNENHVRWPIVGCLVFIFMLVFRLWQIKRATPSVLTPPWPATIAGEGHGVLYRARWPHSSCAISVIPRFNETGHHCELMGPSFYSPDGRESESWREHRWNTVYTMPVAPGIVGLQTSRAGDATKYRRVRLVGIPEHCGVERIDANAQEQSIEEEDVMGEEVLLII